MEKIKNYSHTIIGAGIYGCYAAIQLAKKYPDAEILLLEYDTQLFQRASLVNQARVHQGYHYPRSLFTAQKSAGYYERFIKDFSFAIHQNFEKHYAIAKDFSYLNAEDFISFCQQTKIPCVKMPLPDYVNTQTVDTVFKTEECSVDAQKIAEFYQKEIKKYSNISLKFSTRIQKIEKNSSHFYMYLEDETVITPWVLNTSYANLNGIHALFEAEPWALRYELTEMILVQVPDFFKQIGFTLMDGPFFSLMPFGLQNVHSLSAVNITPHQQNDKKPIFSCQNQNSNCTSEQLACCLTCPAQPKTHFAHSNQMVKHYLNPEVQLTYLRSLFTVKTILSAAEISDARPTVIRLCSEKPTLLSALGGKFNTIYDLDDFL